jgi:hypothetical protein
MTYDQKLKILGVASSELHNLGAPVSYRHPFGFSVTINHKRRMKRLMNRTRLHPVAAAHLYLSLNTKPKKRKK